MQVLKVRHTRTFKKIGKMKNIIIVIAFFSNALNGQINNCEERPSVTFILGEDEKDTDQFYTLAKEHYLTNQEERSNYFVDTCRSLFAVREYLAQNKNDLPWGKINLVLHSNQWTGMSIPVMPDGERTSVETLFKNIQDESFIPLDNETVDQDTEMNFISCGLGKNKDLLYAIQLAFGGFDDQQPSIDSSEDFVYFGYDERQQVVIRKLSPYYAFYRTAYKPADLHIQKQFQNRYPNVPIDWLTAMQTKSANDDAVFHTKFNVPIIWNVQLDVPAERIQIESKHDEIDFVRAQEDLMELLTKYNIPIEKFRWNISVTEKEGKAQAIIKGKSTVVCVLASN